MSSVLTVLHNTSRLELQVRAACVVVCEIGTRLAMACACFLPTCRACCRGSDAEAASQEPEAAPPCACFLPFCRRCFPQAPPGGDGDSGEEHEDTSQESASSDTEPEELAGPAGINAVGPQHSVCACFLPDCLACSSARAGQVLPGESGSQGLPKREWNNWKGRIASESTLSLVASVYDELENMLDAAPPDQILARGQGWSSIVSGDASKGSRLEKVVARLCRCGITTVMQARRRDESCENHVNEGQSGLPHSQETRMEA